MKFGFSATHHDHDYVEQRGGWELLTHLRAAPSRVEYRSGAISRALRCYEQAIAEDKPGPEVCGLGLIVLQRALLAAEDLGRLLHAFAGPTPWDRLRAANIQQLDEAFAVVVRHPLIALQAAFRMPTDEHLIEGHEDVDERLAYMRLRERVADRWTVMLHRAAQLWLEHREVGKATMHGFPLLTGKHVIGPPGAGELRDGVRWPNGLFAVAVRSHKRDSHVRSDRYVVLLDRESVRCYARQGRSTARLMGELCGSHASTIMDGCAATLPTDLLRTLSSYDQQLIERLAAKRRKESDDGGGA